MGLVQGNKLLFTVLQLCRKVGDDMAPPEPIALPLSAAQLEAAIKASGGGYLAGPPELEGGLSFAETRLERWALMGSQKQHGVAEGGGWLGVSLSTWTKAVPLSALNSAYRRQEEAEEAAELAGELVNHISREEIERSLLARALPERTTTTVAIHSRTGRIFVGAPRRRALALREALEQLLEGALPWTPKVIGWGFERSGLDADSAEACLRRELALPCHLRRRMEGKDALVGRLELINDGLKLASKEHGRLSASGTVAEAIERALAGTADAGDLQDELEPLRPVGLRVGLEEELSGVRLELSFDSGLDLKFATTTAPLDLKDEAGALTGGALDRAVARMVLEVGAASEALTAVETLWAAVHAKVNASAFILPKPRLQLLEPLGTCELLDRAPALNERWSGDQRLLPTAPAAAAAAPKAEPERVEPQAQEREQADERPAAAPAPDDEAAARKALVEEHRRMGAEAWARAEHYDSPPEGLKGRALLAWREGWERAQRADAQAAAPTAELPAYAPKKRERGAKPHAEKTQAELAADRHALVLDLLTLEPASVEQLGDRTALDREPLTRSLARLVSTGQAERLDDGRYAATRRSWFGRLGADAWASGVPFDSEPAHVRGSDRELWRTGWTDARLLAASAGGAGAGAGPTITLPQTGGATVHVLHPAVERTVGRACPPGGGR